MSGRVVIVGAGMAAIRLAELLGSPAHTHPGLPRGGRPGHHPARRRAAPAVQPDPAVGRARGHARPDSAGDAGPAVRRPAARHPRRRDPPRGARGRAGRPQPGAVRPSGAGHRQHPDPPADPRPGADGRPAAREGARLPHAGRLPASRRQLSRTRATPSSSAAGCSASRSPARSASAAWRPRSSRAASTCCAARSAPAPARSWPATSRGSAPRSTPAPAPYASTTAASPSTTATPSTPTWSCSPLAAARRRRSRVGPASTCAAASWSTDHLRTSDERIHAIGDCAQHGSQVTGFVPPAWEQAGLLARHLGGEDVAYDGARTVARLRATDLDVAVLGEPEKAEGQVVEVSNPISGEPPQARRPRRRHRRRHPGRRPVPDRPDHPALRPGDGPRPARAG